MKMYNDRIVDGYMDFPQYHSTIFPSQIYGFLQDDFPFTHNLCLKNNS